MKFMVVAVSFLLIQLLIGILQRYSFQNIHILIYILQLQIRPSRNSYSLILTLRKYLVNPNVQFNIKRNKK